MAALIPVTMALIDEAQIGGRVMFRSRRNVWRKPVFRRGKWMARSNGWCEIAGARNNALSSDDTPLWIFTWTYQEG